MNSDTKVAIVGIGGVFPGADSLEEFWNNIKDGVDTAREVPDERWAISMEAAYDSVPAKEDHVYSRKACLIKDEAVRLDPDRLGLPSEFLNRLDPMFRVLLAAGYEAYQDADAGSWDNSRTGVIIGNLVLPTETASAIAEETLLKTFEEKLLQRDGRNDTPRTDMINRYSAGLPAGILSKALGLGGDSFTLDAACASSLYAVKLAVDELAEGRADAMLCGGVARPDCLYTQMGFSQLRAISPSGRSAPFDEKGDGLVVGEGAGIFVLRRLEDAVRDKCRIYGVIRGIGLSNDMGGRLLAPTSEGQLRAMKRAYYQTGWDPSDIDLIECHATGTPVGDAVEFESLRSLWSGADPSSTCVIGSVKSNIGHLLTAAGSAALMKVLFALREQTLPPTANFSNAPDSINMDNSPFSVLTAPAPWKRRTNSTPRRAAVSAFGFGGINAHVLVEEWDPELYASESGTGQKINSSTAVAIIGMDTHFGPWDGLDSFQHRVLGGTEGAPSSPTNWWNAEKSGWLSSLPLAGISADGYYIDEVSTQVDYFRIPPRELEQMLPQQILMLKVATRAWHDAGLSSQGNTDTGVFIGISLDMNTTNFHTRWVIENRIESWLNRSGRNLSSEEQKQWRQSLRESIGPPLTADRTMGGLGSVIASRVARELRLGGPSFTISSEDTSGINALKTAVRNLQNRTVDTALAGAVDMAGDLRAVMAAHDFKGLAHSGQSRPFDPGSEGIITGEGAAAVILKRYEDAVADGDRIYAVIKGIGSATGGKVEDTIPDSSSYTAALETAYRESGISPCTVEYMETNGSGIPDEDNLEFNSLSGFFRGNGSDGKENRTFERQVCALGSVKKDIGHTGAASGLASVIKSSLCLYQEIIPPLDRSEETRRKFESDCSVLHIPQCSQYWLHNREDGPRRAGISSMSLSGNSTHVVLEAYEEKRSQIAGLTLDREKISPLGPADEALFAVTADSSKDILRELSELKVFIERKRETGTAVETLARAWWQEGRFNTEHTYAVSFVCRNRNELLDQISYAHKSIQTNPGVSIGYHTSGRPESYVKDRIFYNPLPLGGKSENGTIAFVFPGSGNQFRDMGRELFLRWPEILRNQYSENRYLRHQYRPDCFWNPDLISEEDLHDDHQAMIFGQVALGTGISDLLRYLGVRPEAAIGYSLGETASLFSLGAWTDRDLMLDRIENSTLFTKDLAGEFEAARINWNLSQHEAVDWVLGVIDRPINTLKTALANRKKAYALISNTLKECVIGGKRKVVEGIVKKLGCQYIPIKGVTLAHCEVLKEVETPYRELHILKTTPPPEVTFYSGSWGKEYIPTSETAADSILAHAIHGIDFPKTIKRAYENGIRIFIEIGPGASCTRMIDDILHDEIHLARAVSVQGQNPVSLVLRCMGQLVAERVNLDLEILYGTSHPSQQKDKSAQTVPHTITVKTGGTGFIIPPLPEHSKNIPGPQPAAEPEIQKPAQVPEPVTPPVQAVESVIPLQQIPRPVPETPRVHAPAASPALNSSPLLAEIQRAGLEAQKAHEKYLEFASTMTGVMARNIQLQMMGRAAAPLQIPAQPGVQTAPVPETVPRRLTKEQCMEFAVGSIGAVFGKDFSGIDAHPTRVRLPDVPLMLVDRVTEIEGEPLSLESGRIVTEHDVNPGDWYLDCGKMPICITVESGQADLMLSGYLGIDRETEGFAVYRLLDADITFHRDLPSPGETVIYDIRIKHFFVHEGTYFFHFEYDGTVNGTPLLTMRNGCAGFFTEEALAAGKGLLKTKLNTAAIPGRRDSDWRELVPMKPETYSCQQLESLRAGDLAACFGPAFSNLPISDPLRIPGGRMKLVDRVVRLEPNGGRYGLGMIEAEADIHPDDWFLTCHFVDDMVMPGTLMYECCMHTLRIFLLRMGWVCEQSEVSVEPVLEVASRLKCRGQVIRTTKTVTYEIAIKEIGYGPEPYAVADARMYADGKYIVDMENMSFRLKGITRQRLHQIWSGNTSERDTPEEFKPALYDNASILAFAEGSPSEAFGERYGIFDSKRRIARLPRPPYKFLDRITAVSGEPWQMKAGCTAQAQYRVPPDEWYFRENRQKDMPFAVLLEIALQPCGWLAAYAGSALTSETDLCFRNLGGEAVQKQNVYPDAGILTTDVTMTGVSSSAGMIIQQYEYVMKNRNGIVYEGKTDFGFFSKQALENQVGVQGASMYKPSEQEMKNSSSFPYPADAPFPDTMMRMNDTVEIWIPDGGPAGLGYIRSAKTVVPEEWFFKAHFFQDPVNPGSLGLEAFIQLLKVAADRRWGASPSSVFVSNAVGHPHSWLYRGQVIPSNSRVTVEASITEADDTRKLLKADGCLMVDGRIIYRMKDFTLKMD